MIKSQLRQAPYKQLSGETTQNFKLSIPCKNLHQNVLVPQMVYYHRPPQSEPTFVEVY